MTINLNLYLETLESFSDTAKSEVKNAMRFWFPEAVPLTYLFGQVGKALSRDFPKLTENDRKALFRHIELGMLSDDESFSTAIATGLIEGLISGAYNVSEDLWLEIEPYLGEESRLYATAWINFGH